MKMEEEVNEFVNLKIDVKTFNRIKRILKAENSLRERNRKIKEKKDRRGRKCLSYIDLDCYVE